MMLGFWILIAAVLSVLVHELGHLVAARSVGLPVDRLSIGFGPKISGVTDRFGTRWSLALIPLGGSCSFLERASEQRQSPGLLDLSPGKRAIIFAAGPAANFIFAVGILFLLSFYEGSVSTLAITSAEEFILLIGGLSLLLGLFSLVPLPPLDGGRLVMIAIEAIFGSPFSRESERSIFAIGTATLTIASFIFCAVLFNNALLL